MFLVEAHCHEWRHCSFQYPAIPGLHHVNEVTGSVLDQKDRYRGTLYVCAQNHILVVDVGKYVVVDRRRQRLQWTLIYLVLLSALHALTRLNRRACFEDKNCTYRLFPCLSRVEAVEP